jgi:hypothetical protein
MAIAWVQSASAGGTNQAYVNAQIAGDTNVVFVGWGDATTTLSGLPFDSSSNTYVQINGSPFVFSNGSSSVTIATFVTTGGIAAAGASGNVVNVAWTGGGIPEFGGLYLTEWSGVSLTTPVDNATTSNASGNSASGSVTSGNTRANNEEMLSYNWNWSSVSGAGAGGWNLDPASPGAAGDGLEYQAVASSGTSLTAPFPLTGSAGWLQIIFGLLPTGFTFGHDANFQDFVVL